MGEGKFTKHLLICLGQVARAVILFPFWCIHWKFIFNLTILFSPIKSRVREKKGVTYVDRLHRCHKVRNRARTNFTNY